MLKHTQKRSLFSIAFGIAAMLILPVSVVDASPLGTVNIVRSGHGANETIDVQGGGLSGEQVTAGVYMLDKSGCSDMGCTWSNGPIAGFCIELEEPAPNFTETYQVYNTADSFNGTLNESIGDFKAEALSELWGRYYDSSWEGSGSFSADENNAAGAFAAAVWEIVYEDLPVQSTGWDVSADGTTGSPGFSSTLADSSLANSWLHSLDGTGPMASLAAFTNDGNQNYVVAVPEPTTVILLGLGGALSLARKRKRVTA
jgi:hypothetical protein